MNEPEELTWSTELVEQDLIALVKAGHVLSEHDFTEATIEQLGNELLPRAIDGEVMYATWPSYWAQLKAEIRILVCTREKKYEQLRKKLANSADKSQMTVVSLIAAAMATQFGVAAGVLVPFCALCLVVLVRIGKEAYCSASKWDMPLEPTARKPHHD